LSIPADDSRAQTSAIVGAIFDESAGAAPLDPTRWHELQDWLAAAEHRVTIPYGAQLGRLIAPAAVRMRRDAKALKTLIEAHALLHQASRQCDAEDRIIATLDDYAAVHELIADLIAEGAGAAVKVEIRETVEAVRALGGHDLTKPVKMPALVAKLALDKSSVSRRVRQCIAAGYLVSASLGVRVTSVSLGEPLPEKDGAVLPAPTQLTSSCTVAP
jgi:hypothetical protein